MSCSSASVLPLSSLSNGVSSIFEFKKHSIQKTNRLALKGMKQSMIVQSSLNANSSKHHSCVQTQNGKDASNSNSNSSFTLGKRNLFAFSSSIFLFNAPLLAMDQQAWAAPKGYKNFSDTADNYTFFYPFGWQEVAVKGLDIVFKDIIEPLESVSVNIIKTDKQDLSEIGSPEEVAVALVEKVLTNPNQKTKILSSKERITGDKKYYTFEFVAESQNYTRHAVATVGIGYGKFYTLVTGANERRWSKVSDKLSSIADSFSLL